MISIEYLNKEGEPRISHNNLNNLDDCELLGMDIRDLIEQGAKEIHIKN